MSAFTKAPANPPSDPKPQPRHGGKLRLRGASASDPEAWAGKLTELKIRGLPLPPTDPMGRDLPPTARAKKAAARMAELVREQGAKLTPAALSEIEGAIRNRYQWQARQGGRRKRIQFNNRGLSHEQSCN